MSATKLDLYATHKHEYIAPRTPVLLTVKPAVYLAIDGQGDPGGARFTAAIGALYAVAFTIKMTRKFAGKRDYAVAKLEAQWFMEGESKVPRKAWRWKLLIRTPPFIKARDLEQAVATLLGKGKSPEVREVRVETICEGRCVQMLHVGPYEREGETIAIMRTFAETKGVGVVGPHHEIYLSDPRRVAPARLRTILREPVRKE
jgi:hypothetical protein